MQIMKRQGTIVFLAALGMLLSGCATQVSERIARAPAIDISVADARADIDAHVGETVRWGGTIIAADNEAEESRLEIVARPLRRDGRPQDVDSSPGRFIALFDGFLDPAIFMEGRDVTVFGTLEGERMGHIGEREYRYPVVRVLEYQLWRSVDVRDYPPGYRSYYYYDPWYWGPYYHPFPRYRELPPARTPERRGVLRR